MLNLVNFAEIFEGKLDETNFENTGTELQMPDWPQFLLPEHFLPLICYFFVTKLIAFLVRISLWKDVRGFKQYRLRNLTVSLIHSIITGGAALIFANIHPFAIFTYELLSHHLSVFFFFTTTICSRKFVPFAYVALLLEVNGICLHIRTLMQISGNSVKRPKLYKLVMYTNIITFLVFRFGVQAWQVQWVYHRRFEMHYIFLGIGFIGSAFFLIINAFLFFRILAADGYLGEFGRKHAAINRDKQIHEKSD
uniref:TLC domain-containing protein n=1 Tax=Panagrolaimus sp. JU765 TaxID=591449 RepID=A0AC34QRQ4_9BILA